GESYALAGRGTRLDFCSARRFRQTSEGRDPSEPIRARPLPAPEHAARPVPGPPVLALPAFVPSARPGRPLRCLSVLSLEPVRARPRRAPPHIARSAPPLRSCAALERATR